MPAARAVSTADISRTSRACLRTAPNDGATIAPVLQWDDENTVEHTSIPWSTTGTAVAGASPGGGPETPLPRMPGAKGESHDRSSRPDSRHPGFHGGRGPGNGPGTA